MSIEASGFLSVFSGLGGLENIQQTLLQDGALLKDGAFQEQFAEALAQQLALLKQSQAAGASRQATLQDFTALNGIKLPPAGKNVDIDLEATLQALSEVMKNIDAVDMEIHSEGSELPIQLSKENLKSEPNEKDLVRVMESLGISLTQVASAPVQTEKKIAEELAAILMVETPGDISEAGVSKAVLVNGAVDIPANAAGNVGPVANEVVADAAVKIAEILTPKLVDSQQISDKADSGPKAGLGNLVNDGGIKNPMPVAETKEQKAVSDLQSLMSEKGDEQAFDQNRKQALPENTNLNAKPEIGADKPDLPKMAADIAMLNRSVINEAKAEMPAMSRQIGHPQWGQELSDKLVWMHKQSVPAAELNLNPRHLGPVSIRVDVNQDQTTISFSTQHAVVKDAIEAALPRLREMLASQQLNLVDVNVSQQQSEQKQANGFFHMGDQQKGEGRQGEAGEEALQSPAASIVEEIEAGRAITSNGILSIFA